MAFQGVSARTKGTISGFQRHIKKPLFSFSNFENVGRIGVSAQSLIMLDRVCPDSESTLLDFTLLSG